MRENLPIVAAAAHKNDDEYLFTYLIPAAVLDCGSFKLLVELVTGGIVVDIDSSKIINIPGLDEISMNELAVLDQGYKLGQFTAKDISLRINSFRVDSIISDLLSKNLVTILDQKYKVTDRYKILLDIEKYSTSETINIREVEGSKLDAKISVSKLIERINGIVRVLNAEECWILYKRK